MVFWDGEDRHSLQIRPIPCCAQLESTSTQHSTFCKHKKCKHHAHNISFVAGTYLLTTTPEEKVSSEGLLGHQLRTAEASDDTKVVDAGGGTKATRRKATRRTIGQCYRPGNCFEGLVRRLIRRSLKAERTFFIVVHAEATPGLPVQGTYMVRRVVSAGCIDLIP